MRKQSLTAKALAISATGMAVGFGTCGLMLATGAVQNGPIGQFVGGLGAVLFFLSLACGVITVVVYLVSQIVESFRK